MKKSNKKAVYDSQGNEYVLTGKIGEGGQGMVCSTDRPGTLVKIINTKDKSKILSAIKQIKWINKQNIKDLNMALPKIAISRPKHGYVMELMDGLVSLQDVLDKSFNDLQDNQSTEEYLNTGSISRRSKLLLEIAKTLSELHSRGYAYGDLSPANIFVSENISHSQAWFIDCDNICFNEREGTTHLYTPGYGAPEVVRSEQNVNCLTDSWSFAVMAFELLTHQHPFKGLYVEDGEPEIVEKQAFEGQLPWVYDNNDDSNESVAGISLDMVSNKKMAELFRRCFDEGKNNPLVRPSLSEWRTVLQQAVDQTLECQHCRHQFFYQPEDQIHQCPFCDGEANPESFIVFEQFIVTEQCKSEGEDDHIQYHPLNHTRILNIGASLSFNSSPYGTELWSESENQLTIEWQDNKLTLRPENSSRIKISKGNNNKEFEHACHIKLSERKKDKAYYLSAWNPNKIDNEEHLKLVQSYRWRFV